MGRKQISRKSGARASAMPTQADYEALSEFRYSIRCFLEFSQRAAREVGLTPRHHQALLAIKGFAGQRAVTVGDLAERLRLRPHSAAELVGRLAQAGLVMRKHDPDDHRRVLLTLTDRAERLLADLSTVHMDELKRIGPALDRVLALINAGGGSPDTQ